MFLHLKVTNQTVQIQLVGKKEDNKNDTKKIKNIIKEAVTIETDDGWILKVDLYRL